MRGEGLTFRPDIEGLRAIAVLLVVLSHAGVSTFAGGYIGVDVFFVISGFLITSLLYKELQATGKLSIAGFYARRMTRLLPASTVVVIATIIGAWLWLPPVRLREFGFDAFASTFYAINLRLAATGTDYLASAATPSPFQHFWSLAVEEQFYLVWPLLLLGTFALFRRRGIVTALVGLLAVSLVLSVTETARSAPWAYFGPHTRAWELAFGALIAIFAARLIRIPGPVKAAMAWAGLVGIGTAAVLFDETTLFPGYAAILPVAATGLLLIGGAGNPAGGTGLLLNTKPFQLVGKMSYGWYLWHWPVLLIVPAALGVTPRLWLNALLALVAFGLAALSYVYLENPIRHAPRLRRKPLRGIGLGMGFSAISAGCILLVVVLLAGTLTPAPTGGQLAGSTKLALASGQDKVKEMQRLITATLATSALPGNITPSLDKAAKDKAIVYADKCHLDFPDTRADEKTCAYGVAGGEPVVLFGDSHAAHWFPAMEAIAQERGWQLYAMTKSSCPAAVVHTVSTLLKRPYDECMTWRDNAIARIGKLKPKLVVMSSNGGDTSGPMVDRSLDVEKAWLDGWTSTIKRVQASGAKVALISDTPWPKTDVPSCVSTHPDDIKQCHRPEAEAVLNPGRRAAVAEAAKAAGAIVIDPRSWLCAEGVCPVVIGDTLVYFDASHMSSTFSRLLAPLLAGELAA